MQHFFVLFAAVLLASEGNGKPLEAEQLSNEDVLGSIEASSEPNRDANVTSVLRNKREAPSPEEYLKYYCSKKTPRLSAASNSKLCEAGSYVCYGNVEIVCSKTSFSCLSSIPKCNYASCKPIYEWVTINLGSTGKRVRRTKACTCGC